MGSLFYRKYLCNKSLGNIISGFFAQPELLFLLWLYWLM